MISVLLVILGGFALPAQAAERGAKAQLVGSTLAGLPAKADVRLDLTGQETLVLGIAKTELRIPYAKINTIEYGQSVSRRYAAAVLISPVLLLSKTRKHYVTLGYVNEAGGQEAIVFRVDKGDIRPVLAGLEARTGRRIEYQDNEARKSGR